MNLNLFFFILPVVAILCISIPNSIVNTSKCTSHWVAILTILSGIAGIIGKTEIAFSIITCILIFLTFIVINHIYKVIKDQKHIEIK